MDSHLNDTVYVHIHTVKCPITGQQRVSTKVDKVDMREVVTGIPRGELNVGTGVSSESLKN